MGDEKGQALTPDIVSLFNIITSEPCGGMLDIHRLKPEVLRPCLACLQHWLLSGTTMVLTT